ncbi:Fasciclin domain protein [Mariniflexile rhizosphaerae]|uniref:fasciclin domain-containing protein n=1 Tax=unclassified Mariniflexile TaxID=2643887 RepID=UPI000CB4D5E4|nr:fasciclin domain-containing protein [Mariniflexile sp. TRM1-10]AXP82856.1 Fasciclin domain protein [Mariniflexile sp. TRM1-10]PLB17677.1 MAG: Beta-Ig-H3/fasciclin [Flavobacteriaceae bacterium FS1-H7996/R]
MKTKIQNLLLVTLLFFTCTLSAQWRSDEVLSDIENPENYTTIGLAQMDRNLSTFTNLIFISGLAPSMLMTDNHTVFIPTNEAFKKMQVKDFLYLTNPTNRADLIKFLKYHFLPNKVMLSKFNSSQIIETQGGQQINVSYDEPFGTAYIGGARIIKSDVKAKNGIIHVVDGVITPTEDVIFN